MTAVALDIQTPEWAEPLLAPARYKGAHGGRGSGKSHFFAELAVEEMFTNPARRIACIREVQRSLKFSVKALVEQKIQALELGEHFTVLETEIRRNGGTGVMIFEGMQNHTADSIKSLEGFGIAWVEEAQRLSKRSLELLIPTLRLEDSELWFSWNPDQPTDPVDQLLVANKPDNATVVRANYLDNPFCPQVLKTEAKRVAKLDPDAHAHIWLGGYNIKSKAQILNGKWIIDEFEPESTWSGPYHGCDFGFAEDPNTLVKCWIAPGASKASTGRLMIEREAYKIGEDTDAIPDHWQRDVPGSERHVIRGDSSRPETISYLKRHGFPQITGAPKWTGSVEDGIAHLRQYEKIVLHERCTHAAEEARLYSYKIDPLTGDILPVIVDAHNHIWDAVRYALAPLIKHREQSPFVPRSTSSVTF